LSVDLVHRHCNGGVEHDIIHFLKQALEANEMRKVNIRGKLADQGQLLGTLEDKGRIWEVAELL
jgi:RNA-binding protein YhbY